MCGNPEIHVGEIFVETHEGESTLYATNLEPIVLRDPNGTVWIMPPLFSWCALLSEREASSASPPPETGERSESGAALDAALEKATGTAPPR